MSFQSLNPESKELLTLLHDRDPRFINALRSQWRPNILGEVVDQWVQDSKSWAVSEAERYLLSMPHLPGHEVVVRRLITGADHHRRHRVLATAMMFVDTLIVRDAVPVSIWDRSSQAVIHGIRLVRRQDQIPRVQSDSHRPGEPLVHDSRSNSYEGRLFSLPTRQYLRRFVWRSIRRIVKESPDAFVTTLGYSLRLYPDCATYPGNRLLECWCLMKALFGNQDDIHFTSRDVNLVDDSTCDQLIDSRRIPPYADAWNSEIGERELVRLVHEAQSTFVKNWAMTYWTAMKLRSLST